MVRRHPVRVSMIDEIQVSFAKEPYKRDDILQKRSVILSILLTVATPYGSSPPGTERWGAGVEYHFQEI